MIEIQRQRRGENMKYNIKDCIERINNYVQRHNGAKPLSQHDKQMISGHILPLITNRPPTPVNRVETMDQATGESELKPETDTN